MTDSPKPCVAVPVRCRHQATAFAAIVRDSRLVLPAAQIHAFHYNASADIVRIARVAA
jgi:hypothetical protein